MSYHCHKTYSHNCNDAHANQQAQPLTDDNISTLRLLLNLRHLTEVQSLVFNSLSRPSRLLATIDALRLALERLQEPTPKVLAAIDDAIGKAPCCDYDHYNCDQCLTAGLKAAAKAAADD